MSHRLKHRQEKIQAKRKHTPWREFVMEIASWMPLLLSKNGGQVSRYPEQRMKHVVSNIAFNQQRDSLLCVQESNNSDMGFLQCLSDLWYKTPFSATIQQGLNENSDYADSVLNSKNIYLSFGVFEACADVCYSVLVTNNCRAVFNSIQITNYSENIYYSVAIDKSSFIFYSKYILNSHNLYFCSNMIGCHDCVLCDGLENQSYCIKNKQLTREEYLHHKAKILDQKDIFHQFPDPLIVSKNYNSTNVDGNCILFSSNIQYGLYVTRANTGRNLVFVTGEDRDAHIYDCCDCGINSVDFYAVQGGGTNASHYYCIGQSESCNNIYYSYYLYSCSYCLGCIGLKNKSYCIFNKQYEKDEWYDKVDEIFSQMEKDGDLGKFFPGWMNPFYFNDTAAYLIDDSFTKEEVEAAGYMRRDEPIKVDIPAGVQTVQTSELDQFESWDADGNWTISDDILKKVILDPQGNAYRVIPMELDFLRKYGLPLPRKHQLDRMKENFHIT